jgi:hypothetical protein
VTSPRVSRPIWFDATILGFLAFLLFLATANFASRQINDAASALTSAWSLGQHGTWDMSLSSAPKPWAVHVGGHFYSDRLPGVIGWAVPFYALLGRPSAPTVFPSGVAVATAAALIVAFSFILFQRLAGPRTALGAAIVLALGTSTWSVSGDALFPHGPDQVWLLAFMIALSSRRWWLAGLAGALLIVTRPTGAAAVAVAGLWCSMTEKRLAPAVRIGIASSMGLGLLLVYNRLVFSHWALYLGSYASFDKNVLGHGTSYSPTHPLELLNNIAGFLVSPSRGLLVLSPFLLLLIPGLRSAWRVSPSWVQASALGAACYTMIQLWTNNFGGGSDFYGYRYALEPLTLASPLLLLSWQQWTNRTVVRRRLFAALAIFSIFSYAAGAVTTEFVDTSSNKAWNHYLLIDALEGASIRQLSFVVLVTLVVLVAALVLETRRGPMATQGSPRLRLIEQRAVPAAETPGRPSATAARPTGGPTPPSR